MSAPLFVRRVVGRRVPLPSAQGRRGAKKFRFGQRANCQTGSHRRKADGEIYLNDLRNDRFHDFAEDIS